MSLNFLRNFTSVSYRGVSYKGYGVYQIPLCHVTSFPSVVFPVYPKMALLPKDYYHLVTPEVVTISDKQCSAEKSKLVEQ